MRVDRIDMLHPVFREQANRIADDLHILGFRVFETYRSPVMQAELFAKRPRVTDAREWQSAHQYGLAVDFVKWTTDSGWDWTGDYSNVRAVALKHGAVCEIKWDPGHVQSSLWPQLRRLLAPR